MLTRKATIILGLACAAGLLLTLRSHSATMAGRLKLDGHRELGVPQSFRNLTLIPVYDSRATAQNAYITLDEGLKAGLVKVKESPNGGEVNTLYISNLSKRPLYLMAGEVVLGGQQDRTVGSDQLLAAGKRHVPITVFCVEHGRWTGQDQFGASAKMVASADIRESAQNGAFDHAVPGGVAGPAGPAGETAGRIAAQPGINVQAMSRLSQRTTATQMSAAALGEAQEQVWAKVEKKNSKFNAQTESGTYRVVLNMANGDAQRSVAPYIKALSNRLGDDPHLVGAVAAINGKVVAADIFGNTTLFRKLWPKLLRSYAADAAENAPAKGIKPPQATSQQARLFLAQAAEGKSRAQTNAHMGVLARRVSRQSVLYTLAPTPDAEAAGHVVHENILRK